MIQVTTNEWTEVSSDTDKGKRKPGQYALQGFKQGQTHLLKCSRCNAPLANVVETKASWDIELSYQADCPHCGDHSYAMKVKGGVFIGETDGGFTKVTAHRPNGNKVTISTSKGPNEYVR